MNPDSDQLKDLRFSDYLRPILGRKWMILGVVILATAATYFYYDRQSREYTASTQIFVSDTSGADVLGLGSGALQTTDRTIQNQATLLLSRDVVNRVAVRLKRSPEMVNGVSARPTSGSDFLTITAVRPSAAEAAAFANAFADAFLQLRRDDQRSTVQKALTQAREQLRALPRSAVNTTEREGLQADVRRLQLTLALPTGNAQQLDRAAPPSGPSSPKPVRNAVFAFFLSLLAAVGLAFLFERFDRRLKRVADVGPAYGLPLLAVVPHSDAVAMLVDGRAALSPDFREAFRQLRTNLQLEGLNDPIRRILVTSAVPGEGKSTVVRNLALAFGEFGQRVAVMDADLRRPVLPKLFGTEVQTGLTTLMTGVQTLEESLVRVPMHAPGLETLAEIEKATVTASGQQGVTANGDDPAAPHVTLLPSGPAPANPQAVLAARRTAMVIGELSNDHDIVVIDSPPITVVSDALAIAEHVDAVVFVAHLDRTTSDVAKRAIELMSRVPSTRAVGVVVNDLSGWQEAGDYRYEYSGDAKL